MGRLCDECVLTAAIVAEGATTSIVLSAISVSADKVVLSGVKVRTVRAFWGNVCKNSSFKKVGSMPERSPSNCCIL